MVFQNVTARTGTAVTGNDVDLFSEEYRPTGRHLGDTPQAFSMEGLVNTARRLTGASARTAEREDEQAL